MMPLTEELEKAVLAVRLVVLFFEGSFVELLEAEGTDKVFRVKFLAHSSDAASRDRLLAPRAERAAALVVMHLAVGLPVMLKEAAVDEWRETFLQEKAEGDGLYHKLGLRAAPPASSLRRGTTWLCSEQGNCCLSALPCYPKSQILSIKKRFQGKADGQIQATSKGINDAPSPSWFHFYKKIQ